MKIVIGLLPFEDPRGIHQVQGNRQYQVFHHKAFIYPYMPAMAATLLKQAGHEILWLDGEAEGLSFTEFVQQIMLFKPDYIAWEVKTPSIIKTWQRARWLKFYTNAKIILFGDHVTALPEESIEKDYIDIVITGGDYDFALLDIVEKKIQGGIYDKPTDTKLEGLPTTDRILSKWWLYANENGSGNYKYLPGTHTYFGRDCWWRQGGGCTFCSWTNTYKNFRVCTVSQAMAELESCASLGIREVFDDTGTFPCGAWLHDFCRELRKFNKGLKHGKAKITMGCNMRPGALEEEDWKVMGASGFRFILFGLESAVQSTIKRINKGQRAGDIERSCLLASRYGMDPHATCMVGYPWESRKDAQETISLTKNLFKKGHIKTLQATVCIPYPGTELYRQCLENDWLKYLPGDWDKWDMRQPVMKCPMSDKELLGMTRGIYKSCITPVTVARKLFSIRSKEDIKF